MKFSIKKNILLENLNNVSHAVSNKNVIPVLGGIKFELNEEGLYLTATDNDIDIQTFIEKKYIDKVEKNGSIVIQGKFLLDIVRKLPDGLINFEVIDGLKIMVYTTNSNFNLNGIDPSEFPNLNIEKSKNPIILNKKIIRKMVNQTIFASSTQESRPILTGLNIKINDNKMECIATDSYRLAKKTITLNNNVDNLINIVIPSKNIGELVKILTDEDEEIKIHIFTNKILFEFDNLLFQSRLLNGNFPDITVTSNTPEIGKVEEKLPINKISSEDIKIAFSAKYMMDALRTITSKDVKILLNTEISPIILNNEENDDLIQLLLPIKTY